MVSKAPQQEKALDAKPDGRSVVLGTHSSVELQIIFIKMVGFPRESTDVYTKDGTGENELTLLISSINCNSHFSNWVISLQILLLGLSLQGRILKSHHVTGLM